MTTHRIRSIVAFGLLVLAFAAPASTAAAPPDGSCAGEKGRSFALEVPAAVRTPGVHRFEYRITLTFPDGTVDVGFTDNEIEIDPDATAYDNVLLRLVSNRGLLADKTVDFDVQAMRPNQRATFYAQFSSVREDAPIVEATVMEVRYETTTGTWSDWTTLARSPMRALCAELTNGLLRKANGWAG